MRLSLCTLIVVSLLGSAPVPQAPDPERLLSERFGLTAAEVGQARAGQPVAKIVPSGRREELAVVGALRLQGDKARLAGWVQNIQAFRQAAEIGVAHVIPLPTADAAFADLVLDAKDLAALQRCRPGKCDIKLSPGALAQFQAVPWGTGEASSQATAVARKMLTGFVDAYAKGGRAGLDAYGAQRGTTAVTADIRGLFQRATVLSALSPALLDYLGRYPAPAPAGTDQVLYWSSFATGSDTVVSLHHLVVFRPTPEQTVITDQTLYATRYFDAGVVVIALMDAPGGGYYAVAGSRLTSSQLGGVAASVFRRQVERGALDSIVTYLAWVRDSLSL